MPSFGGLVIKNPGPDTTYEYIGLSGEGEEIETIEEARDALGKAAKEGDTIHLFVLWDDQGDTLQLAVHDIDDYVENVDPEEDEEEEEKPDGPTP